VFCILDFKFLVEGICSGLVWKIDSIIRNGNYKDYSIQNIREQYGYLLEEYFGFLMKKAFPEAELTFTQEGMPDCIVEFQLENKSHLLILEFATKYFKISSLYNKASDCCKQDLNRILFSKKRNDKGKLINLNKYVNDYKSKYEIVIPILVTENWLGDFDLLNRLDAFIGKGIHEHGLDSLALYKPLIISLDDLETFWAISTRGNETQEFTLHVKNWENSLKGKHLYNFSYFISEGQKVNSREYSNFFAPANLVADD
jgi:hypothetical protein